MEFPDRAYVENLIDPLSLPRFHRVRYEPESKSVTDPRETARSKVAALADGLEAGSSVAVGVGSRGIHHLEAYVDETVTALREQDLEPVIVPAMGSHGGATPEGQREMLEVLGVTEESAGAPIDARMDVERLDEVTIDGTETPVYFSAAAGEADAVFVINRVKPHTNFTGRIESGLSKMTVVGLGKQKGAKAFHSTAIECGYVETMETYLSTIRESVPLFGGLAIVENFHEETAHLEAIPSSSFEEREPDLLELAYEEMPTLPVDDLDLLVVDEIGKEISGAGMDTNVIGRYQVLNTPDPDTPAIKRIYVRRLTEETKGNASGLGLADVINKNVVDQLDIHKTYANALTSGSLSKVNLPVVAPDDELALRTSLSAVGGYDPETARIAWIRNTAELSELRVSGAVLEEIEDDVTVLDREKIRFEDGRAAFESA